MAIFYIHHIFELQKCLTALFLTFLLQFVWKNLIVLLKNKMFFKLIFIRWGYKYLIGFVAITANALLQVLENDKEYRYYD